MHKYLETLRRSVPFLDRGKPGLPRGEVLSLKPLRNREVAWEIAEGEEAAGARLTVPRREDRTGQLLSWIFKIPQSRVIELDEFGAQVWERCDGRHSVDQLIKHTCDTYKLNRRQGEVSVLTFMKMLAQRRLIGFPGAGEAARPQSEGKETTHVNGHRSARQRAQTKRRRRH